jgi:predicted ATP-dependent serine protease
VPNEFDFHDSGLDLAIAAGIISQYRNQKIWQNTIFVWELWLWGQLVKTKLHEKRIREVPDGFETLDYQNMKNIVELKNVF